MNDNDRLLSCEELAQYLGISVWTIYQWINQRRVPYIKLGRLVKFRKVEIESWLASRHVKVVNDF